MSRHALARGQASSLAALEVTGGERVVSLLPTAPVIAGGNASRERVSCPSIRLRPLGLIVSRPVEQQRLVDHAVAELAEAHQVQNRWSQWAAAGELVQLADLRVAVAVRRVGELDRDVRLRFRRGNDEARG
jgi:hypothetical protein